jgi:hypothetical protein
MVHRRSSNTTRIRLQVSGENGYDRYNRLEPDFESYPVSHAADLRNRDTHDQRCSECNDRKSLPNLSSV